MPPIIEALELHRTYGQGDAKVVALGGVNLRIEKGEVVALVGASGAGKSTLLNILGCIDRAASGQLRVCGIDVADSLSERDKAHMRNRFIGRVFQDYNLIQALTVRENVEMPLLVRTEEGQKLRTEKVQSALDDVGLAHRAGHFPSALSGGEKQRVGIARAMVIGPQLLLADEPTANLDSKTAAHVTQTLLTLNQKHGVTLIFATHDERLIRNVSRIIEVHDGKIIADRSAT